MQNYFFLHKYFFDIESFKVYTECICYILRSYFLNPLAISFQKMYNMMGFASTYQKLLSFSKTIDLLLTKLKKENRTQRVKVGLENFRWDFQRFFKKNYFMFLNFSFSFFLPKLLRCLSIYQENLACSAIFFVFVLWSASNSKDLNKLQTNC